MGRILLSAADEYAEVQMSDDPLLAGLICNVQHSDIPGCMVESHVVRGAGGLNRSPNSTSPPPGHDTRMYC
eukprot:jgi/Chrzof1/9453/Cz04g03200.t1